MQSQQAISDDLHAPGTLATALPRRNTETMRLPAADILRGLAASWVFLFHASEGGHIDRLFQALPETLASLLFSAGHLGVAVFFVLSGLVISMSGERCGGSLAAAGNFLARRIIRLAPPYYLSLGVVLGFLLLKQKFETNGVPLPAPNTIFAHLVFVQDLLGLPPLNSVYWTLCIEIQFYFTFCALMLLVRCIEGDAISGYRRFIVIGVACAVAALWPLGLAEDDPTWHATFLPTWHLFLLGVLLHHALKPINASAKPFIIYFAILTAAGIANKNAFTLAGVATSVLLYSFSRLSGSATWNWFGLLTKLGLISYSFYLLHNPITGAAFNVTRRLAGNSVVAEISGLMLSFCLCLFAAAISYIVIERPAIRWGRQFRT